MGFATIDFSGALSSPYVAFALRAALGSYIVWMARAFYVDPLGYFRRWMPRMTEYEWERRVVRWLSVFCLWGGCFIVATALVTQIFGLHGWPIAIALVLLSACAAYLLLPKTTRSLTSGPSGGNTAEHLE